jgi:IS1 family transposase
MFGKRTSETCSKFIKDLKKRIKNSTDTNKLNIFSDGNFEYEIMLNKIFDVKKINYGVLIKVKEGEKLVEKIKKVVFGNLKEKEIETTYVEGFNTILRNRQSRLVRKSQCHAKKKESLKNSIELFQFYWNFMKLIKKKLSPAMIEGLSNKIWTWGNFLHWFEKY